MIYLDSGVVMRLVEGIPQNNPRYLSEIGNSPLATSSLALTECLCKPLANQDKVSLGLFQGFFASSNVRVFPVTVDIAVKAAELRARLNFKTPDAIHVATALITNSAKILTTDTDFEKARSLTSVPIVVLSS